MKILAKFTALILLPLILMVCFASAKERPPGRGNANFRSTALPQTQTLWNINNIAGWIRNDGYSGNNPFTGNSGVKYPRGTAGVIFWDGIVWGGRVFQSHWPQPEGSYRVGGQTYNICTQPGHVAIAGTPADPPVASDPLSAYIYRIRADWEELTVNDPEVIQDAAELNNVDTSQVTPAMAQAVLDDYQWAWNNWPADLGAPFYDLNGNSVYEPALGETPGLQNADQVVWFVFNDLDPALTNESFGCQPIGLEVQATIWGYKTNGVPGQAIYQRYRLINKSGFPVDSMFIGAKWADPDVGVYTDDLAGCDSLLDLGFCYNGYPIDNEFQGFGLPPAAIGYALLQGPLIPSPGDTAWFDFQKIPDHKNRPMTASPYNVAVTMMDPIFGEYEYALAYYNLLNGYIGTGDTLNPSPFTHGSGPYLGQPTKFPINGDPVTGIGDVDGQGENLLPGDRRLMVCSGPFSMQNGDTQEVVFAVVGGIDPAGDHLSAVAKLKENVQMIRASYPQALAFPKVSYRLTHPSNTATMLRVQADLREFSGVTGGEMQFSPETGGEPGFSMPLYDDGLHHDSLPGDNIWGNAAGLNNRKFPFKGDLAVQTVSGQHNFEGIFSRLRLRPLPDFSNWRVVWENGQQDSSINHFEKVRLAFDLHNRDQLNAIDNITLFNFEPLSNNQTIQFSQLIPPGGTASDPDFNFVLVGPPQGDSLRFSFRLQFDYNSQVLTSTQAVLSWAPGPYWGDTLEVIPISGVPDNVFPIVADPSQLTGHFYQVAFFDSSAELRWRLTDQNTGALKLDNIPISNNPNFPHPVVDGILYQVTDPAANPGFVDFQTVANAAGPLIPPEGAAAGFAGFPSLNPTANQQVGEGIWLIHTAELGFQGSYFLFIDRITRNGSNWSKILGYDYEMRLTAGGSYAWKAYQDQSVMPVPFELWNIGANTPNDPGDDYRMVPWVLDDDENGAFNMGGPGTKTLGLYDHTVSPGEDDPFTDWIYWMKPEDTSPGQAGYLAAVAQMLAGTYTGSSETEVMARVVLANWNGDIGIPPPSGQYNQDLPEAGTIFRIRAKKPNLPGDVLVIHGTVGIAEQPTPDVFELSQNYPNPFNPVTHIQFSLAGKVKVKLEVFNVLGQRVKTLVDSDLAPGKHEVAWDGRNDAGARVGSGLYFYRLKAGDYVKSRKMILIK
ncbi:MAG: T9SS type A sorting domain-containing protein [Calditrichaceae bacterium]|nr:T9SS type A sorting domain-containing protein [Calditrichia bacterium]NUQ40713.1 T9SS type A sorting domain-containing protein [Calditrichaceae bacterium]